MSNNIALYRKYRPKDFKEVIGQKNIVNTLKNMIQNNNILHAYIFSGTRGTGKTTIAKIFAKALNCLNLQDGYNPCLECENCKEIDYNQSTDVIELDAASNNGVDEIRNIVDNVMYLPQKLKKKVYIIDEAHMLSNSAWNALLKTLEEPPKHVVFILATTEFHKIPITIVSRCQRYDFYGLEYEDLSELIDNVALKEKINITPEAKDKLIQLSDGAARDCLSLLEQLVIYSNNNITIDEINKLFGLVDLSFIIRFIEVLLKKDILQFIKYLAVLDKNYNVNYFIDQIINCLIDLMVYTKTKDKTLLKILNEQQIKKISLDNENAILDLLDIFYLILKDTKTKGNPIFYLKFHLFEYLSNNKLNNNNNNNQIQESYQSPPSSQIDKNNINIDSGVTGRKLLKKEPSIKQPIPEIEINEQAIDDYSESNNDFDSTISSNEYINDSVQSLEEQNNKVNNIVEDKKEKDNEINNNHLNKKIDYFEIYQKLALNNIKSEVEKLNLALEKIKTTLDDLLIDESDKLLVKMSNFYLFSNNASFLICNDLISSNRFNELFLNDKEFREKIRKTFNLDKLFIFTITKYEAIQFNKKIKESNIQSIETIDYSKIKTIFNEFDENDIKQKLLNKIKNNK